MEFEKLGCPNCGETLTCKQDKEYSCNHCGCVFKDTTMESAMASLKQTLGDSVSEALLLQRDEDVAKVRRNIYKTAHAEFIDAKKLAAYCHDMKKLLPEDFQARFYDLVCSDNVAALTDFVTETDVADSYCVDMELEFLIKTLSADTMLLVNNLISNAYENTDIEKYAYWQEKLQPEAQKVDDCVYDVTMTRDVFVAYKSEDMPRVLSLVDYLERQEGLTCFVAARNLQHGKAGDYNAKLQQAINNCKAVVFVSSKKSRKTGDARNFELPYIKQTDMSNGPAEYKARNDYKGLPSKYKKPRVEYVVEEYANLAAEAAISEFFAGYERCYDYKSVAASLFAQFQSSASQPSVAAAAAASADVKYCSQCGAENPSDNNFCKKCGCSTFGVRQEQQDSSVRITLDNYDLEKFQIKNKVLEKYLGKDRVVVIPDGVEKIGFRAFANCKTMTEVKIPESVTAIETCAFTDCGNLTKIVLPNSVKSISKNAFSACDGLTEAVLPSGIRMIDSSTFMGCVRLVKVVIPYGVTVIGDEAFWNCKSLTSVSLPASVVAIKDCAFGNCMALREITVPASVTKMGSSVFSNCSALTVSCQATKKPDGWADNWTVKNVLGLYRNVKWGSNVVDTVLDGLDSLFKK